MYFSQPSIEEITTQTLMEYGPNSPRTRMTVAAYLIENGWDKAVLGEDFETAATTVLNFVTGGIEPLLARLAELLPVPDETVKDDNPKQDANDDDEQNGYAYL